MPAPVEKLWELVESKRFDEIKAHIQAHKDANLINAIEPGGDRTLPIYLLNKTVNTKEAKPRELLYFLLSHPQMDWKFVSLLKQTVFRAVLDAATEDGDFSVIESLRDVSRFIFNDKLAYEIVATRLNDLEKMLASAIEHKKPTVIIDRMQARRDKCEKALALIRDITILHAIKIDNVELMDRLDKAGGEPLDMIGDLGKEMQPAFLIGKEQPNTRLKVWKKEKLDRDMAEADAVVAVAVKRLERHDFFVEQERKIRAEHAAKEIEIHNIFYARQAHILDEGAQKRAARIGAALERVEKLDDTPGCKCSVM